MSIFIRTIFRFVDKGIRSINFLLARNIFALFIDHAVNKPFGAKVRFLQGFYFIYPRVNKPIAEREAFNPQARRTRQPVKIECGSRK